MGRPSFHEQRLTIIQLLEDHAHIYQGGESHPDFEEKGPPGPGGNVINAAFTRRNFGTIPDGDDPKDPQSKQSEWEKDSEARSHERLWEALQEMRVVAPLLAGSIDDVHFRSTAGQKDGNHVREKAKARGEAEEAAKRRDREEEKVAAQRLKRAEKLGDEEAASKIRRENKAEAYARELRRSARARIHAFDPKDYPARKATQGQRDAAEARSRIVDAKSLQMCYDWGLDLLTAKLWDDRLHARFALRRSRLEEKAQEKANAAMYAQYLDFKLADARNVSERTKNAEAKRRVSVLYNVSVRTVERVIESRGNEAS